ncbi:MAG: hypothetical protein KF735_11450 [Chelatococcus sp.]|uniref:hypothetical protein n=1 Tax=Chelatococcus sp. TaxID=1953771 RepID=UPI0025C635CC|nr:hypothetical protein [Chelatococcus sp.]MBX3538250.1 hypothetical protein [Chelatococcus sp.]
MGGQNAAGAAFDTALCHLGDIEVTIERKRHLIERLRAAGCSTHYAETLLLRFEVIRAEQVRMLSSLNGTSAV